MHVPAAAVIHSGAGEGDALLKAILTECQQRVGVCQFGHAAGQRSARHLTDAVA